LSKSETTQSLSEKGFLRKSRARQLVQQFRATASDEAQALVDRMAVLPVNWSVIRLVQKNWRQEGIDPLQETGALPLAEIFLSGLLRPAPRGAGHRAAQQYDFVEGVRDVLLGAIPISEAQEVGEEVAGAVFRQLPPEVQERVAADIERRYGESLSYFEAFLIPDLPWGEEAEAEIFPFARVAGEVLRRWGREYAALAEELEQTPPAPGSLDLSGFPPLKTGEFEEAIIIFQPEWIEVPPGAILQPFEFEVALIEVNQSAQISTDNLLEMVDEEVFSKTGKSLNDVERLVVEGTLANQTYQQIAASAAAYSVHHLKNVGIKLWEVLSEVFAEKVSKRNLQNVLKRWAERRRLIIHRHRQQAQCFIEDLGNGVQLEMVAIPEGSFLMGSPAGETGSYDDEKPQHEVHVPSFYMGRYSVTQAQWRVVAGWEQVERELDPDPSRFEEPYQDHDRWTRPVEQISWHHAQEFCARLSKKTGKIYRLPTEAEWEYACRAVTSPLFKGGQGGSYPPFHFGETITTDLANYRGTDDKSRGWKGSYGEGPKGEYREQTTPVGYFKVANAFGLYDMHGLVWEWCEDDWHSNYEGAPSDGSAWLLSDKDTSKIIRGGSWFNQPDYCRSASRISLNPGAGSAGFGLRVVCAPPRTP
jgi:formylglycine-generating enzyme required for sulfatase activity